MLFESGGNKARRERYPEQWPNETNSLISRLPVSLVDSHLEGPHPHPPSFDLFPCWEEEEKGGGGKSGIATKIAVFVNNLPGKQTRLHPQSESKVPSHEAQQRRDFFLSVP